jgi:uncharacterized repeat protein (TIGR03803 family)
MIGKRLVTLIAVTVALLSAFCLADGRSPSKGTKFTTLWSFGTSGDVAYPESPLVFDKNGNLYGLAYSVGVFELSPSGSGWTEKVFYEFSGPPGDGAESGGNFAIDAKGNLYGATWAGGNRGGYDYGTLFEITSAGSESFLYKFVGPPDGASADGVIRDTKGNLYGETAYGGTGPCSIGGCGTVFEVTKKGKESILYSFTGGADGSYPLGGLTIDKQGNLYGTTLAGGIQNCPPNLGQNGCGVVFELTPGAGGWTESILYSFTGGADGGAPGIGLIFDKLGNLYGETAVGGAYGYGTAFKLTPSGGTWTETVLHSFNADGTDGTDPTGLVFKGTNLYGTTWTGGSSSACSGGCGTVFEITSGGGYKVLHSFSGSDGANPGWGLTLGKGGIFYGATFHGGDYGAGTVFTLKP